mmetsp:Transcript_22826/g.54080  ORF Transcript_22826/g.54080 Transcript_22826/m.54080 type:complete len:206 (-) Transcript_22826:840-1457(-)
MHGGSHGDHPGPRLSHVLSRCSKSTTVVHATTRLGFGTARSSWLLKCTDASLNIFRVDDEPSGRVRDGHVRSLPFVLKVPFDLFLHGRIPMVLDGVVGTPRQDLGDFSPTVPDPHVTFNDDPVLVERPSLALVDAWVKVIVPPFTALLPCPALEMGGDGTPFLRTVLGNQVEDLCIFDFGPWDWPFARLDGLEEIEPFPAKFSVF